MVDQSSISAAGPVLMFPFLAGTLLSWQEFFRVSALIEYSRLDDHPLHHGSGVRHA
jgi:hypothetical protein